MPDELQPISDAIKGLLYPSESDEPFTLFRWPGNSAPAAAAAIQKNAKLDAAPAEVSVADFFHALESTTDADRFARLRAALQATLKNLQVFRIGEIQVAIFFIGRNATGDWAGVRTLSIET
jgi:hypothetical protein